MVSFPTMSIRNYCTKCMGLAGYNKSITDGIVPTYTYITTTPIYIIEVVAKKYRTTFDYLLKSRKLFPSTCRSYERSAFVVLYMNGGKKKKKKKCFIRLAVVCQCATVRFSSIRLISAAYIQ